jgi:hypothetical protein
LLYLRLQQGTEFAQFRDHCGLGSPQMSAEDWIQFVAIDSWREVTVHKWQYEFKRVYPPRQPIWRWQPFAHREFFVARGRFEPVGSGSIFCSVDVANLILS